MIGSLRGTVLERSSDGTALVEVGGVGYVVSVTPRTLAELEPTSTAFLYIHHHIRDDAQTLYGFATREERMTFEILIATHGIGPALAVAILATHSPPALVDVVGSNDLASLTMVPGVGKKTAERLMVELRSRLGGPVLDSAPIGGVPQVNNAVADVREALAGLGYAPEEIRDTLREIGREIGRESGPGVAEPGHVVEGQLSNGDDAAVLLREALKLLGARRA